MSHRRGSSVLLSVLIVSFVAAGLVPAGADQEIMVGVGKADITWRFGQPIAPNPNVFDALHSRAWAKAIAVDGSEGRFVLARTDMLLITGDMHEAVARRVERYGIDAERLFLSSSHTHVTNNGMFPHPAHGVFYKSFDPREHTTIADRIADAIGDAVRDLRPATLASGTGHVTLPAVNRRYTDREALGARPFGNDLGRLDPDLGVLRFDDARTGEPIAVAMNYGLHPVVLINKGAISADFVGWVEHQVETELADDDGGPMALWFTGAEGDQDPIYVRYSWPEAEWTGRVFADEALRVAAGLTPQPIARAAITGKLVPVPPPGEPTSTWQPAGPRTPVAGPASLLIPSSIRLEAIELSTATERTVLMGWPGEPIRDLGVELKDMAVGAGFDRAWVVGLANDWSGYYVTPEEFDRGRYEASTFNFYGREAGTYVQYHLADLARALAQGTAPETVPLPPNAMVDRLAMGAIADAGVAASGPLSRASVALPDADPAITVQPSDIQRREQALVEWIGGSPDVARGWIPSVQIQRRAVDGTWLTVAREGTGEVLLEHAETEPGVNTWRARWEPLVSTPAGAYRVLIDGRRQAASLADEEFALVSDTFTVSPCTCIVPGELAITAHPGAVSVSVSATYREPTDALRYQASTVRTGNALVDVRTQGGSTLQQYVAPFVPDPGTVARTVTVRDVSGQDLPVTIVEPAELGAFERWIVLPLGHTVALASITDAYGNTTP